MENKKTEMIRTKDLDVLFPAKKEAFFAKRKYVHAVSNANITVYKGETFGLVGESGCGKSTLANATLGFVRPTRGGVYFEGELLDIKDKAGFKAKRLRMQKIFQDPASSLNPRFTVDEAIREPLLIRGGFSADEEDGLTLDMIKRVGLSENDRFRNTMEFSGGQQQRIAIARALILKPEYLVCDEPVSALDVSVHAQILNLLMDLQKELGVTYLFISHNLAVVKKICSRLAIMYLGEVVESGCTEKIFADPRHPYTKALMSAVLTVDNASDKQRIVLKGDIPSPIDPPKGCRFALRCPEYTGRCKDAKCELRKIDADHYVACPFASA